MESTCDLYSYQPLESATSIRVLVLHPASSFSEPLHADLVSTDRMDMLRHQGFPANYEAISYCWGPSIFSHELHCDDCLIPITSTVDTMLRYLRKTTTPRFLWIDAICLNQNNNIEKAVQVQLMGEIYREALKVHIWLGEGVIEDRLPQLFALFRALVVRKHSSSKSTTAVESLGLLNYSQTIAKAVRGFLSRPWFQRRWILQEVALGHDITVRCGSFKCAWTWVLEGISILAAQDHGFGLENPHTSAIKQVLGLQEGRGQILDLVWKFDTAQCSDPRDKLFALCGMADNIVPPEYKETNPHNEGIGYLVDYSQDVSSTYIAFTNACIDAGLFFHVLQHVASFGSLAQLDTAHPTWVPNWNLTKSWECRFRPTYVRDQWKSARRLDQWSRKEVLLDCRLYGSMCSMRTTTEGGGNFASQLSTYLSRFDPLAPSTYWREDLRPPLLVHLSQIISAAVLDAHLSLDNGSIAATEVLEEEMFRNGFRRNSLHNFADSYDRVAKQLAESVFLSLENWSRRYINRIYGNDVTFDQLISAVCEILDDRIIFYDTMRVYDLVLPGIGPSNVQAGDYVFQPKEILFCKPETIAFMLRPWKSHLETLSLRAFRFIGFCFLPEIDKRSDGEFNREHRKTILLV
jgi:hypothetical protein